MYLLGFMWLEQDQTWGLMHVRCVLYLLLSCVSNSIYMCVYVLYARYV